MLDNPGRLLRKCPVSLMFQSLQPTLFLWLWERAATGSGWPETRSGAEQSQHIDGDPARKRFAQGRFYTASINSQFCSLLLVDDSMNAAPSTRSDCRCGSLVGAAVAPSGGRMEYRHCANHTNYVNQVSLSLLLQYLHRPARKVLSSMQNQDFAFQRKSCNHSSDFSQVIF